jgi:hypothetical protein
MAEHTEMVKAEEHLATRWRADSGSAAEPEVRAGYAATHLRHVNLGGRGNGSTRTSVVHNMQCTHGNRAVQRYTWHDRLPVGPGILSIPPLPVSLENVLGKRAGGLAQDQMVPGPNEPAIQSSPTEPLEILKKHMGDGPGFEYIRRQMGMEPAQTDAQAVDDAQAIDDAQSAITGRPPLESAPPMVPIPAIIPDPHKDFPGEGALEYRNVSPQLEWWEFAMQEQQRRELAPSGMGGWGGTNISNPAGDLMSRRHRYDGMSVW